MQTSRAQACVPHDLPRPFNHSDHNCKISFFSWRDQQVLQGYEVDENALPMGQYKWISSWIFSWGKYGVWEAKQLIPLVSSRDQFSHSHKSVLQKSLSAMCSSVGMWLVMSLNKFWRILFLPQIKNHMFDYTSFFFLEDAEQWSLNPSAESVLQILLIAMQLPQAHRREVTQWF